MKVIFFSTPNIQLRKTPIRNNQNIKFSLPKDTVSFSGKINPSKFSANEQAALSIASKLIQLKKADKLNKAEISQVLNMVSPVPISVHDLSEIPPQIARNIAPTTVAHMLPGFNPQDLSLAQAFIYLKDAKTSTDAGNIIANAAHEFTHVLQYNGDKSYYGIKNYTNNPESLTTIARSGQAIYQAIFNATLKALYQNAEFNRRIKGRPEFSINDIERYMDKQGVLKNMDTDFKNLCAIALRVESGAILKQDKALDNVDIVKIIKNWVKQYCEMEKEAYNVTIEVLKRYGKFNPEVLTDRSIARGLHSAIARVL